MRPNNLVLPALVAAAVLALLTCGFLTIAPNRLVSGKPIMLLAAVDGRVVTVIAVLGFALLSASLLPGGPLMHRAAAIAGALILFLTLAAAGRAADALELGAPPLARVSLGAGFWVLAAASSLAVVDGLQRAGAGAAERLAVTAAIIGAAAAMAVGGMFDPLSLAREYMTQRQLFANAVLRHIALVAGAVGPAVLIGFPLGVTAARRPRLQAPLFAVLNLLQTIPSIALFGLLIVPLSVLATGIPALAALGVGGVGAAPAIVALTLYALLPVARNSLAGIAGVDPAVVDAARGMGMTAGQIFRRVELPLAMPLLLAGLRIVIVQAVGLAVVAALIGAGGLGTFVFEGLGQYAADLVLLGALPAIGLALAADFFLRTMAALTAGR